MTLPTRFEYAERFDALAQQVTVNLRSLQLPSLATFASNSQWRVKLDYDRSREVPLQLSTEAGQPCSPWRHKFANQWIAKVEGAIAHGRIEILQAVVPVAGDRTTLSALYARALDGQLWGQGPICELFQRVPARIRLEVTDAGESVGFEFAPYARPGPSGDLTSELISADDLESATRHARQHWSDFCAKAAPWLAAGGISKLVILGSG